MTPKIISAIYYFFNEKAFLESLLLERLKTIRRFGPRRREFGICMNANNASEMLRIAPKWKHYSGSTYYPVPDPKNMDKKWRAEDKYLHTCKKGDMWTGEYGRLRRDLLDFCIETLEKERAK